MYFLKSYWNFYENNSRVLKSSKIGPHLVLIFLRRSLFYHYNAVDLKSSKQDFVYARTEYETFTAFPLLLLWKSSPTRTERKKHKKRKHQQQLQEGPWVRLWNIISQFVFIAFTGWWVCSVPKKMFKQPLHAFRLLSLQGLLQRQGCLFFCYMH